MSVVGFDLGNKSSIVAVARRRGIEVLQNEIGSRKTTSSVGFSGGQRFLGEEAVAQASSNIKNTIIYMKRLVGKKFDDPEMKEELKFLNYKTEAMADGGVGIVVQYDGKTSVFSPEQVLAAMFCKLKMIAEQGMEGQRVVDCVLACPAYWTDVQRRAYLAAANVAGLNVLRLMNETTAIALNYGILRPLPKDTSHKVMFVDFGQTCTQVSVVSFQQGKLTVLGTAAARHFGGRDFDRVLGQHFAAEIKAKYNGLDVLSNPKATLKLMRECERVKTILSANSSSHFNVEYILNDTDVKCFLKREEFETMSADLLKKLVDVLDACMASAGVTKDDLHSIEVVGGVTRIPMVQKVLTSHLGKDMSKTCDSDESVARGCALQCAMLSPNFRVRDFEIHDVTAYAIQITWGAESASAMKDEAEANCCDLFTVNGPAPSVKMISFKDWKEPFQLVARYSDSSALPAGTDPLIGRFIVSGLPKKAEDQKPPKIKVKVKLNLHGVLVVSSAQMLEEVPEPDPVVETGTEGDTKMADVKEGEGKPAEVKPAEVKPAEDKPAEDKPAEDKPAEDKPAEDKPAEDASMDTSGDDAKKEEASTVEAKPEPEMEKKKKKKVKRTDLKVESFTTGSDQQAIQLMFEKEAAMANADRVIAETNEARNAIESYVLEMRSKVRGGELSKYILEADAKTFGDFCTEVEDWLYDEGFDAQKSTFKDKLKKLKITGDPIEQRFYEATHREEAVAALQKFIGKWEACAASTEERYSHIESAERSKVISECRVVDQWLAEKSTEQSQLPLHADPKLTIALLQEKGNGLEKFATPIMNKVKPAPKPEPVKEPEAKAEVKEGPKAESKAEGETEATAETEATPAEDAATDTKTESLAATDSAAEETANTTPMNTAD